MKCDRKILSSLLSAVLIICTLIVPVQGKGEFVVDTKNNLLVAQSTEKDIKVLEVSTNGKLKKTLYSSPKDKALGLPWHFYNNMITFQSDKQLSIYNINSKKTIILPNSKDCYPSGFVKSKPYIVYSNFYEEGKEQKIYIFDYSTNKVINTFDGYSPTIAAVDDTIYFMKLKDLSTNDFRQAEVSIYSYNIGAKGPALRNKVRIDEDYTYSVTEVSAQSKDFYTYRIYDEHEYRYYYMNKNEEAQFYDGGQGTSINQVHKEQYDLVFSDDKKAAAFTERNWNELTYLIYVDLVAKKRTTTKNLGSFPNLKNGKMYFLSDPSFVNTKDEHPEFRQIKNYAIYEYDPKAKKTNKIIQLDGMIAILSAK